MKNVVAWTGFILGVLTVIGYYAIGPAIALFLVWWLT